MTGNVKPDYLFKLPEEPGLLTIEDIIRMKVEQELYDAEQALKEFKHRVMVEIFDTRNGKYAKQYRSEGKIPVEDAIRKFS